MAELMNFLIVAICAGSGAYFGSYLKKKGENLATHEDVQQLVTQMSAVTQATKEIEAKISNEVWDRQKRWEIKKEAIIAVVGDLSDLEDALSTVDAAYKSATLSGEDNLPHWQTQKSEAVDAWGRAMTKFKRSRLLASFI